MYLSTIFSYCADCINTGQLFSPYSCCILTGFPGICSLTLHSKQNQNTAIHIIPLCKKMMVNIKNMTL